MKTKPIVALCLIITLSLLTAVPALAADVEDVKAEFAELQRIFGSNAQMVRVIDDALDWFAVPENAATITTDKADIIVAQLKAAQTTAGSASSISALSQSQLNSIISNISTAASTAGFKFEVSISGSTMNFLLKDAEGRILTSASTVQSPIKQTGNLPDPFAITAFCAALLLILIASAMFYLSRKPVRRKVRYDKQQQNKR